MIDISPELVTILMLGGVFIGVLSGYPLAIVIGFLGLVFGFLRFGLNVGEVLYPRAVSGVLMNYPLLAAPLFIFMGLMLERSGIAERLYDALYTWLGGLRGGLAIVTVLIGTIMAACVGIIAASITMLAVVALPSMIRRGYDKSLASGSICAGGTLGILIPPSIMLVLYGPMASLSVGRLFFGAFVPGFILSGLYISYIAVRSLLQPNIAPPVPIEQRKVPFLRKSWLLATSLLPAAFLILSVLGTIFFGIAPPTEAAAIGGLASVILVIAYRRFNGVFIGAGGDKVVTEVILSTPGGKWGAFAVIMFISLILGMFIDWIGIVFIMVPIVTPIGAALGFDPIWFAIMICVNLQMSFMTPPFAMAIFIVRGAASKDIGLTMTEVIRGVIPFVILIMIGITLCAVFPQLVLWLPSMMIR
jgi:TRAP-type mannitol/chloroaromatic compound transport system permease large subunit